MYVDRLAILGPKVSLVNMGRKESLELKVQPVLPVKLVTKDQKVNRVMMENLALQEDEVLLVSIPNNIHFQL